MKNNRLKINEVFHSLQGQSTYFGLPTVFVRLSGCPLRCNYCDTEYAFYNGKRFTIEEIIETVQSFSCKRVCITGGEPLAQQNVLALMAELCDLNYAVSLETSGALDISSVDSRVTVVLDLKTPGSGEVDRNLWSNLALLASPSQVKMVICDRADFLWAKKIMQKHLLADGCEWLLSPEYSSLKPALLADWILEDGLLVRMQVQLHKFLWQEAKGR